MSWKWWFTPRNPRFVYMLAGSCLGDGIILIITGAIADSWVYAICGAVMIACGLLLVNQQRRREDYEGSAWAKYQNKEFDKMCDTAMRTIASRINDDLEKAGHGRPVHVQEVSVH